MNEITINVFENKLLELINSVPLPNRVKWYIVKDTADKLLKASENDLQRQLELIQNSEPKQEGEQSNE